MEDAEAVEEALDVVARRGEGICGSLVTDDDAPSVGEQLTAGTENLNRIRHVVQRLVDVDEVVATRQLWISRVLEVEGHSILDAATGEVALRAH